MVRFEHLRVPDQWRQYWTKYPEGYTILEALLNWVAQVDNMVDNQNALNAEVAQHKIDVDNVLEQYREDLDDFLVQFEPNLRSKVVETLTEWQNSGFLNVIIDEALQTQIDKLTFRKHYLTDQGLKGDDTFRPISEVFPAVTLEQVKLLHPDATLANSADWYIIQKLVNELEGFSSIVVDGKFIVDLPINIRRHYITIEGKTSDRMSWAIKQIGVNQSLFRVRASYPTLKNMLLTGVYQGANKTKHGIEIYGDAGQFNQSDHMIIENCYIQNFGGSGLYANGSHFILNKFKDCIIYNCFDNGVEMEHTADQQMNAMEFDNVSTYDNGLEYVNGSYQRMVNTSIAKGHGMKISGTGLIITGGDSSNNASAGVYIHDSYYNEGMSIIGRYFENNKLANLYSEGRKPINLVGNYMYPVLSELGNMYFKYPLQNTSDDLSYELLKATRHTHKPIVSYKHTSNKEVHVTGIDTATNEFISNGHGLVVGDSLYPIINADAGAVYPVNILPAGITIRPEGGYRVVNVNGDRFQVSLTSNGAVAPVTSVSELTKWHFEVNPEKGGATFVTNMTVTKQLKIKAKIKGKLLTNNAPTYIYPVGAGVILNSSWIISDKTTYSYPELKLKADLLLDIEVRVDCTHAGKMLVEVEGFTSATNTDQTLTHANIAKRLIFYKTVNGVDGLAFSQCYLANGTTVDIYLDE